MKAFLEHFAAIVGSVTVVILAMSLSHEYGYFWSIGRQYQTFLTTTDYLSNGVLWLPLALFTVFNWIDWWRLKEEPLPKLDWKTKGTWVWAAIGVVIFGYAFATFTWPIRLLTAVNLMVLVVMFWSKVWPGYAAKVAGLEEPFNRFAGQLIRLGPPMIVGMFLYGSIDAGIDLERKDRPYVFHFKDNDVPQLRIFLRNFDKGVLVRNAANNSLEFYKWDNIVSISRPTPEKPNYLICDLTSLWCPDNPSTP